MSIVVLKPGMLSSFQDLGRVGYQQLGVPCAGAMDQRSHQLANLLAGNETDCASLEITLLGPTLQFTQACCIALTGADLSGELNGQPIARNRPVIVRAQDILSFGTRKSGTRAYLAVHGGFGRTPVLGSCSTFMRSSMGGWEGRALKRGDEIALLCPLTPEELEDLALDLWEIKVYLPAAIAPSIRNAIRFMPSDQWPDFTETSRKDFIHEVFRITPDSERMGYRLQGPQIMLTVPRQMISEATTFGTIQVPAGGQPIVLMADRQTTGGYPKIGYVATVDLPVLAQMGPGDSVRFESITLDHAQAFDAARGLAFARLSQSLAPLRTRLLHHREHHDTQN